MSKKKYSDCWIDYPGKGRITDRQVWKFVKDHTHWWDRLDPHKMTDAGLEAQLFLMGVVEKPKKKRWYLGESEGLNRPLLFFLHSIK